MIAGLSGTLVAKQPPSLAIKVNGVVYEMQAPMCTFYALPEVGDEVDVLTHMVVREDAQILYAFVNQYDRALFRELLKVRGVGAKVSLAILSGLSVAQFRDLVMVRDVDALTQVPGIGGKTAERLIVEMRSRLDQPSWQHLDAEGVPSSPRSDELKQQAEEALLALGYKKSDAKGMLKSLDTEGKTIEEIIRAVLQAKA